MRAPASVVFPPIPTLPYWRHRQHSILTCAMYYWNIHLWPLYLHVHNYHNLKGVVFICFENLRLHMTAHNYCETSRHDWTLTHFILHASPPIYLRSTLIATQPTPFLYQPSLPLLSHPKSYGWRHVNRLTSPADVASMRLEKLPLHVAYVTQVSRPFTSRASVWTKSLLR